MHIEKLKNNLAKRVKPNITFEYHKQKTPQEINKKHDASMYQCNRQFPFIIANFQRVRDHQKHQTRSMQSGSKHKAPGHHCAIHQGAQKIKIIAISKKKFQGRSNIYGDCMQ